MAGTGKKWLIGCGLGCGLFVALGLGLGAAGWYGVRHVAKRAESIEAAGDSLAVRFGPAEAYAPPIDGSLAADRLEAFLEARRLMESARERTSRTLAVLDGSKSSGVPARIVAGVSFVPQLLTFVAERDRALLTAGMGTGEYLYIYTVAFFGLLDRDPGDGPGFKLTRDSGSQGSDGANWSFGTGQGDEPAGESERESARRERAAMVREELNRVQRVNLRRQLAALDAEGAATDRDRAAWRAALAAELTALDNERRRFAWEEGLPEATRAALEPFRDRFEASYDTLTGVLELRLGGDE